ncbi:hypothetical protein CRUP_002998 [Coryphaenoides rupestris]|nr:hypothetical protein CRUP_002998 [Coryphaenoides rupestris]
MPKRRQRRGGAAMAEEPDHSSIHAHMRVLPTALAGRYRLLQRVSSLFPPSVSRPGDTMTLSTATVGGGGGGGGKLADVCFQPVSQQSLPERYRPRVAAAVKGFLTRRLLRTERVQRLRRTAKLRSARYELHDVCFSLSAAERMQLISWDRELARERELKQQDTAESQREAAGARIRSGQRPSAAGELTPQRRPAQLRTTKPQRGSKTTTSWRR